MSNFDERVYLNASDVAAAIGQNRFKSREDIVQKIYDKIHKTSEEITGQDFSFPEVGDSLIESKGSEEQQEKLTNYKSVAKSKETALEVIKQDCTNQLDTDIKKVLAGKDEILNSILDEDTKTEQIEILNKKETIILKQADDCLKEINKDILHAEKQLQVETSLLNREVIQIITTKAINTESTVESIQIEKCITENLKGLIPEAGLDSVSESVKRTINTNRGTNYEETIINDAEISIGKSIQDRNSELYYLRPCDGILVGGRIDGYIPEDSTLVEVKRRRNRFLGIPKYEKIQCEIYMRMLDITKCLHIEEYNGQQKERNLNSSDKLWNEIVSGLEDFLVFNEQYSSQIDCSDSDSSGMADF